MRKLSKNTPAVVAAQLRRVKCREKKRQGLETEAAERGISVHEVRQLQWKEW